MFFCFVLLLCSCSVFTGKINVRSVQGSTILLPGECFGIKELVAYELKQPRSDWEREATYVTQTNVEVVCVHRCDFECRQNNLKSDVKHALDTLGQETGSPVAHLFDSRILRNRSSDWHFRVLPPKFTLCKDLRPAW